MKHGQILTTKKFDSQGFGRGKGATFRAKEGHVMVYMYLGTVTPESAPHFSADGAIAALGYGPIMTSAEQLVAVRALKKAHDALLSTEPLDGDDERAISEARQRLANFENGAGPTLDPVLKDAARFNALLNKLANNVGAAEVLSQLLARPDCVSPDVDTRGELLAIIDAATAK